jgi:uncharacterized membrane protein
MKYFFTFLAAMAVLFIGALTLPSMFGAPQLLTPIEVLIAASFVGLALCLCLARRIGQAAWLLIGLAVLTLSYVQHLDAQTDQDISVICMKVAETNRITWDIEGNPVLIRGSTTNTFWTNVTFVIRCASPGNVGTNTNTFTIVAGKIRSIVTTGP